MLKAAITAGIGNAAHAITAATSAGGTRREAPIPGMSPARAEGRNSPQANITSSAIGKATGPMIVVKKAGAELRDGLDQKNGA